MSRVDSMRAELGFQMWTREQDAYRHGVEATLTIVNSGRLGERFLERRRAT